VFVSRFVQFLICLWQFNRLHSQTNSPFVAASDVVVVFTVRELLISSLICQLFIFLLKSCCIVVSGGMC